MKTNLSYYGNAYYFSSQNGFADVIVCKYTIEQMDKNTAGSKTTFMVEQIDMGLNDDDEIVQKLSGYENGIKKEYDVPLNVNLSDVKKGDIVQFHFDINKLITSSYNTSPDVVVLYKVSEEKPSWRIDSSTGCMLYSSSGYNTNFQISYGNAVKNIDGAIGWDSEGYENIVDIANISSVPIVVYNKNDNEIKIGSVDDILTYESAGTNCSKIMYVTRSGEGMCAYVIN